MVGQFSIPLLLLLIMTLTPRARAHEAAVNQPSVPDCEHLLATRLTRSFDLLTTLRASRGPVVSRPDYDVTLVVGPGSSTSSSYSPHRVLDAATRRLDQTFTGLQGLGFAPAAFTHVLVVVTPGILQYADFDNGFWQDTSPGSQSTYRLHRAYGVKRGREVVPLIRNSADEPTTASFLVLSDFGKTPRPVHAANSAWVIAHEAAHFSEGQRSVLWSEARADVLAYLVTGQPHFSLPFPMRERTNRGLDKMGEPYSLRRLDRPAITRKSKLVPRKEAEHDNSQILSAVLYMIGESYGRGAVVNLIHHIDQTPELHDFDLAAARTTDDVRYVYRGQLALIAERIRVFGRDHELMGIEWILRRSEL